MILTTSQKRLCEFACQTENETDFIRSLVSQTFLSRLPLHK